LELFWQCGIFFLILFKYRLYRLYIAPSGIGDLNPLRWYCLGPLVYLLSNTPFKLFVFPTFRPWAYLMKVIL
jgi:hypothetical protein